MPLTQRLVLCPVAACLKSTEEKLTTTAENLTLMEVGIITMRLRTSAGRS